MKVLIIGDVHLSQYSSIIRKRGEFYSERLENLLWSINWAEKQAEENNVDKIIYLGDFFDRSDLNAEELTAFRDIRWAKDILHVFLVGNHEVGTKNLQYSSIHFIESLGNNFTVIDKPTQESGFGYRFLYLPYTFESERKSIGDYWTETAPTGVLETQEVKTPYIFSHNDLKGVNYGLFESREGFDIKDIKKNCSLFVNGHIHNTGWIEGDRILNLGNLTGQHFNEDATRYPHQIMLLDTDKCQWAFIENPYAFNFYKVEIKQLQDLPDFKSNAILTVKCPESKVSELREKLSSMESVKEFRVISVPEEAKEEAEVHIELNSVDHLKQFQEYILNQLGNSEAVIKELQEVVA